MKKLFTWIMVILCVVVCAGSVMSLKNTKEKETEKQYAQATVNLEEIEARLSALEQDNDSATLEDYGNRINALENSGVSGILDDYGNRINALENSASSLPGEKLYRHAITVSYESVDNTADDYILGYFEFELFNINPEAILSLEELATATGGEYTILVKPVYGYHGEVNFYTLLCFSFSYSGGEALVTTYLNDDTPMGSNDFKVFCVTDDVTEI